MVVFIETDPSMQCRGYNTLRPPASIAYADECLLRLHADDLHLKEMLPDRWAAAHPGVILTHRREESGDKTARTRRRRARSK